MLTWTLYSLDLSQWDSLTYAAQHPAVLLDFPLLGSLSHGLHSPWVLAQQFQQDILGDLSKGFGTFVKTGRLWAMLIGFVIGYIFRSLTSYG